METQLKNIVFVAMVVAGMWTGGVLLACLLQGWSPWWAVGTFVFVFVSALWMMCICACSARGDEL